MYLCATQSQQAKRSMQHTSERPAYTAVILGNPSKRFEPSSIKNKAYLPSCLDARDEAAVLPCLLVEIALVACDASSLQVDVC